MCINKDEVTQATSLKWIQSFISTTNLAILPFVPNILPALLPTLSQTDVIKALGKKTNRQLISLVHQSPTKAYNRETYLVLLKIFKDEREDVRVATLDWLIMLNEPVRANDLRTHLLDILCESSEQVAKRALSLLALSNNAKREYGELIHLLVDVFMNKDITESRKSLIIRSLCISLDPFKFYTTISHLLETTPRDFTKRMVQHLNLILLTCTETAPLRQNMDRIFNTLYKSWCHSFTAVFSLCLICAKYDHASSLLECYGSFEISVNELVQLDKLVQLLESPVFTRLRLNLLSPKKHPSLYKCMYGILMLLPQSSAFATLRNRLNSVNGLVLVDLKETETDVKYFHEIQALYHKT